MFKINLASFDSVKEIEYELKKNDISFESALEFEDGLKLSIVLTKDKSDTVIVEGRINGNIISTCSRCLEEHKGKISTSFAVVYKEKSVFSDDDEESESYYYENNSLDLYDYIRDTMILEIPIKPVCSVECKGLCSNCGKNLNKEKCEC